MKTIIEKISGWSELSAEQLLELLEQKTIHYVDKKPYRLDDIAKLIGDANMNTFLDVVRAAGYEWMITQAASGFYPYEDPINSRLRLLNHPLSLQIANHTNRMVSILEQNNLVTTVGEVAQVQASMKLALYVESQIDARQDQLNCYKEAMQLWDGNPATEPEF